MSSDLKHGAVLYAKDVALVQAFYQEVLGLVAVDVKRDHVVLEAAAFQLVILEIPGELAYSITIENPPKRRTDTPIKLVFPVRSIAAARAAAMLRGGEFNPPEREWKFQGHRVCDGQDPEGNVLQVRETRSEDSSKPMSIRGAA